MKENYSEIFLSARVERELWIDPHTTAARLEETDHERRFLSMLKGTNVLLSP